MPHLGDQKAGKVLQDPLWPTVKGNTVQAKELGWSLSLAQNLWWLPITYRLLPPPDGERQSKGSDGLATLGDSCRPRGG